LIAGGADIAHVSGQLGHASPVITLRIYAHEYAARDNSPHARAIRGRSWKPFGNRYWRRAANRSPRTNRRSGVNRPFGCYRRLGRDRVRRPCKEDVGSSSPSSGSLPFLRRKLRRSGRSRAARGP
jgi:hypothetical protein